LLLKTIRSRVAPQKSFVYGKVSLVSKGKQLALEVEIQPPVVTAELFAPGAIVSNPGMIDYLIFHTTWETVYRSAEYAVAWSLARRTMTAIKAIAVDEVQWQRGHHYLTLVYQIDAGIRRLLWVGLDPTEGRLRGFFQTRTDETKNSIRYLCSDMWKPYLNVLAQEVSGATHVLDRFHIMQASISARVVHEDDAVKGRAYEESGSVASQP
jgi:Transposase